MTKTYFNQESELEVLKAYWGLRSILDGGIHYHGRWGYHHYAGGPVDDHSYLRTWVLPCLRKLLISMQIEDDTSKTVDGKTTYVGDDYKDD